LQLLIQDLPFSDSLDDRTTQQVENVIGHVTARFSQDERENSGKKLGALN
jgi:hypothetical protein